MDSYSAFVHVVVGDPKANVVVGLAVRGVGNVDASMRKAAKKVFLRGARLAKWCSELLAQGKKLVFTNGCFDILHFGHTQYLERARSFGDALIVGINSDRSVRNLKGPTRPVHSEQDRARVLAALECVDAVIVFDEETPMELIKFLGPQICVKGADWRNKGIPEELYMKQTNGQMRYVSLAPGRSTTKSIEKIVSINGQRAVRGRKRKQK